MNSAERGRKGGERREDERLEPLVTVRMPVRGGPMYLVGMIRWRTEL
jgi:hypothetical protein